MTDYPDERARDLRMRMIQSAEAGLTWCGFYHPADQALLRRMADAGLIDARAGTGRDTGLMLCRLRATPRLVADQSSQGEPA